jgi:hypothetical protein
MEASLSSTPPPAVVQYVGVPGFVRLIRINPPSSSIKIARAERRSTTANTRCAMT